MIPIPPEAEAGAVTVSGGKGKSWRKPVPKYIPSPPPSPPPSSPAQNYARLSVSLGSAMDEMPSISAEWNLKESLDKAFGVDGGRPVTVVDAVRPVTVVDAVRPVTVVDAARPVTIIGPNLPVTGRGRRLHHPRPKAVMEEETFHEVDLTDLQGHQEDPTQTMQTGCLLTVPPEPQSFPPPPLLHTYRPPTPPLPSHKKLRNQISTVSLMKPAEFQMYPDLAGLGEPSSVSDHSTTTQGFSGGNLARHTMPPSVASWLTSSGTMDSATFVDEDRSSLPSYYTTRKQSCSTLAADSSQTQGVWGLVKSWTGLVLQKARDFCNFWNSC